MTESHGCRSMSVGPNACSMVDTIQSASNFGSSLGNRSDSPLFAGAGRAQHLASPWSHGRLRSVVVGTLTRLRIALADRPGALARVAGIIGDHGGNIVSIDVHRAGVVNAIDDMVVMLPEDCDLGRIRQDLVASGLATVLSHQTTQPSDPVVTTIRRAAAMVSAPAGEGPAGLIRAVEEICASPVVWIESIGDVNQHEAGRFALERGGAIALRSTTLPIDLADRLVGEVWLLAVPDAELVPGGRIVFVARPLSTEFTNTEIARVEALMAFQDRLERLLTRR